MEYAIATLILFAVALFVLAPLRWADAAPDRHEDSERAGLEARKEAKLREIRELELDRAAGKLTAKEFEVHDTSLRREAIEILRELDALDEGGQAKQRE